MNFTWFASSYDTDDVPYRLLTIVQMAGVLVLAAGVPAGVRRRRLPRGHRRLPDHAGRPGRPVGARGASRTRRAGAPRCATPSGSRSLQVGWLLRLVLAETGVLPEASLLPIFVVLVVLELAVPLWAERRGRPAGTRTTSPSATGCSRSSCSARASSPRPPGSQAALEAGGRQRLPRDDRRRRARAALRALVALLPGAGGRRPGRAPRPVLPLGLRPLRHLRGARGRRRRARGRRRADRAPPRGVAGRASATPSRSRWASSSCCCGRSTRRSCRGR